MNDRQPVTRQTKSRVIDWGELHRRLDAVQAALQTQVRPEDKRRMLNERAKALARVEEPVPGQEQIEVVEFTLAYERYAIETDHIREVYPLKELTWVPCTPKYVLGVVNVRGQILSVIDLKKFFDLPEKGLTEMNKLIIVQRAGMTLGVLADTIVGVQAVAFADLQAPLPTLTGIRAEYLKGLTKDGLVVLDAARLLGDRSLVVQEETTEMSAGEEKGR